MRGCFLTHFHFLRNALLSRLDRCAKFQDNIVPIVAIGENLSCSSSNINQSRVHRHLLGHGSVGSLCRPWARRSMLIQDKWVFYKWQWTFKYSKPPLHFNSTNEIRTIYCLCFSIFSNRSFLSINLSRYIYKRSNRRETLFRPPCRQGPAGRVFHFWSGLGSGIGIFWYTICGSFEILRKYWWN